VEEFGAWGGTEGSKVNAAAVRRSGHGRRERRVRTQISPSYDVWTVASDRGPLPTVRQVRRRLADIGPEHARAQGDFTRVSLPLLDCDALRDLLIAEQARVVIEIGLAYGSSALAIGEALVSQGTSDVKLVIIDAYQHHFRNAGREAINAAGLSEVCTLVTDRSQLVLPGLVSEGFVADAAFVDGSHIFHNVFVDLYFLRELVRPSGLIIMDDCQWQSVATAVGYFEVNTGWRRQAIDQPTRLRAFRLPDPGVEPSFEEFKPFGSSSST
jgi:predicted O-methyltransferase YrrM